MLKKTILGFLVVHVIGACTVANYGIGSYMERPDTYRKEFRHSYLRDVHMRYFKIKTKTISRTHSRFGGFWVQTGSDTATGYVPVSFRKISLSATGQASEGMVMGVGVDDGRQYLLLSHHGDPGDHRWWLDKIAYIRADTYSAGQSVAFPGHEPTKVSYPAIDLSKDDFEGLYLKFGSSEDNSEAYYSIEEIRKIQVHQMSAVSLTGFFTGIGLLTDITIGLILIL